MAEREEDIRQVTPALVAGAAAGLTDRSEVELARGLRGSLYTFGNAGTASTVMLTRVRSSVAFMPALACRDRATIPGRPAELPAERWVEITLESAGFNARYLLLALEGQDPVLTRELFSPSLIAWLEREPPRGFSFELNEGFLAVILPRHLDRKERDRLVELASEVSTRIDAEIAEEGEASLDVFEEPQEIRGIERALVDIGFDDPPESVQAALSRAKARAGAKPATLVNGLWWGAISAAVAGGAALLVAGPIAATAAAALVGLPALYLGWLVGRAKYRWGRISVDRAGLEGWTRGYATSRGLSLEDRWRFHGEHKNLPLPGFADHVLSGRMPGGDVVGHLLFLGDAAELRATGQEMAYTAARPLASTAILVTAGNDIPGNASGVELPQEYRLEITGRHALVWRPVTGNMLRTSEGTDRFCERAGAVLASLPGFARRS